MPAVTNDQQNQDGIHSEVSPPLDNNRLALDRTFLANERTYQAWIRTGVSTFAAGLGVVKFLKADLPQGILLTTAAILLIFSAMSFLHAAWRYCSLHFRMVQLDIDSTPSWLVRVFSFALAGCSLLALIGILLTVN